MPVWANKRLRPYLKKILHKKRAGGVAQGEGPEFKPQYCKKKKKKKKKGLILVIQETERSGGSRFEFSLGK
jgi:hypothetical protein